MNCTAGRYMEGCGGDVSNLKWSVYLVAATGNIGLEGMCRLEFSVCMAMGGRTNVAVECHTQYRHKPSSLSLHAEIAHHDSLCP